MTPPASHAAEETLAWSTYLRTGPGNDYAVIDELTHDTTLDVRQCNAKWCQVAAGNVIGYVDKDSLALYKPPPGSTPIGGPQGCFYAGQYSWRTPEQNRYCQTEPSK